MGFDTKFTGSKMAKISESGIIGTDGKLRMPMDRLNAFFAANKGQRVVVQFEAAEPGTSEAQLAYYYNYIVPAIQTALLDVGERKTERQTDIWLREQCVHCTSGWGDLMEAREMNQSDFSLFLEWLKQFAAENLFVYIEDPKTI